MEQKNIKSIQEWNPIDKIFDTGEILRKDQKLIKILKITSINFSLKTEFEKESILNSYKILLKTCNFPFQIVVQSTKEDLTKQEYFVKNKNEEETEFIQKIAKEYIGYLKKLNNQKSSSRKNFYIVLEAKNENFEMQKDELRENYMKIKECLSRCGNYVYEVGEKEEVIQVLKPFFYPKGVVKNEG